MGDLKVLLLTALVEEHRALVELLLGSTPARQIDHELELTIGAATVNIVCLSSMGNVTSAAHTATLLATHRPQFVILSGIAGGFKEAKDYKLGDIKLPTSVCRASR
jgi:nucleoside phosphorylase